VTPSTVLTFVGKSFAKKKFRFYYEGLHPMCKPDCKLFQSCQKNLIPGNIYEIVEIIHTIGAEPKVHSCPKELHNEEMYLVRVKVADLIVTVRNKDLYLGSSISYSPIDCSHEECHHYEFCVPELMVKVNDKIILKEQLERIKDCAKNEALSKILVEKKIV